jgi:hypothetical protein
LTMTSGDGVSMGTNTPNFSNATAITSGATVGSTSIVVASAGGIGVGGYLVVSNLNDGTVVTNVGSGGTCTWCDGGEANGGRAQGQIVEVEAVNGTTITINPPLYTTYSLTPHATPFTATKYAGLENLQIVANGLRADTYRNIAMSECAYCWVNHVESNYSDGDHLDDYWGYRDSIVNSYFSNSYLHLPGVDSDVALADKTSATLVQNNIFERLHVSIMLEWGAAGNVLGYNYALANFDTGGDPDVVWAMVDYHGAHPQFNLEEGNVGVQDYHDSVWGSSANNTDFRNWWQGSAAVDYPIAAGRNTVTGGTIVTCGSLATSRTCYPFQASRALNISYPATSTNIVGNVLGSAVAQSNCGYNTSVPCTGTVASYTAGSGQTDAVQWPTTRSYDAVMYDYSFGYGEAGDTGSGTGDSTTSYSTAFLHGNYGNATSTTIWAAGVTHTLPASFYLASKPSWWGSLAWPAIGPDVTTGDGPGTHAYLKTSNPAENCYLNVMGGADGGAGSPLTFNPAACGY